MHLFLSSLRLILYLYLIAKLKNVWAESFYNRVKMASKVTTEGNTTDLEIKTDLDVQNSQQPAIVEDIEGTEGVEEANPRTSCDDAVTVESNEGDAMGAAERENLAAVKKSKLLEGISQYRRAVENTKVHSVLLKVYQ